MSTQAAAPGSTGFIPATMDEALNPAWLTMALGEVSGSAPVVSVELSEVIRTMASKVRIKVQFANDTREHAYCLKAFWGEPGGGGLTTIREGKFYRDIGPRLSMRLPKVPAILLDEEGAEGILIMEDLIAAGARFCSALEPFTPQLAMQSLDQLARLHADTVLVEQTEWLPNRIEAIAERPHYTADRLQELLNDGRAAELDRQICNAERIHAGLRALAHRNRERPLSLVHGDCHAGNLFELPEGLGFTDWQLIQRGHWALDVAYHICAVLTPDDAKTHERHLLREYLAARMQHGGWAPDWDEAWSDYRAAQLYGYYHWAITSRGEPSIVKIFTERLGAGVARHDSFALLGL